MAEVNNINNIAREIVSNLDRQDGNKDGNKDGNEDGKIEASIWNKFVCKKEGNEIRNYIRTDNAVKSVVAYLKREMAKTGQAIEDIANEWLKNVGGGDKTEIDETKYNKSENDLTVKPIIIEKYDKTWDEKELGEQDKQKVQQVADKATQLLMDVANGDYRYQLTKEGNEKSQTRTLKLKDGRDIVVILDKQENQKWKIRYFDIHVANQEFLAYGNNKISANVFNAHQEGDAISGETNNTVTIQSVLSLVQKIFGDDIEV